MRYPIFTMMRPRQFTKNGLVLLGVLFSGQWTPQNLFNAFVMFASFCAMASATYIVNDIFDRAADSMHPAKYARPIASGITSVREASGAAIALSIVSMSLTLWIGLPALAVIVAFAFLNLGYSRWWKRMPILDVFVIASGYVLRAVGGTTSIDMPASGWMYLCAFALGLFLGFGKCRSDLVSLGDHDQNGYGRDVIRKPHYKPGLLNQFLTISAAGVIISYASYTLASETKSSHHTDGLIVTVPFVVYAVFRYLYVLHMSSQNDDSARKITADHQLLAALVGWVIATATVLAPAVLF